jgi:hypothetical protein
VLQTFAQSPAEAIPKTGQALSAQQTIIAVFFTVRKLIVLDILPKGGKLNQLHLTDYFFGFAKRKPNFRRRVSQLCFWVHMDNSL